MKIGNFSNIIYLSKEFNKILFLSRKRFIAISLVSYIMSLHLSYHLSFVDLFIIPVFVYYILFIYREYSFSLQKLNFKIILIFSLLIFILINILYSYNFAVINYDTIFTLKFTTFLILENLIKLIFISIYYLLFSYLSGTSLLRITRIVLPGSLRLYVSICCGLTILGTVNFFLSILYKLDLVSFFCLTSVITILLLFERKNRSEIMDDLKYLKLAQEKIKKTTLNPYEVFFIITSIIFILTIISASLHGFQRGSDALRSYFVIPQYILETTHIPTYGFIKLIPFFNELIFTPAYLLGNIPIISSLSAVISISSILGMILISKEFNLKNYLGNFWIIILAFSYTPILYFYVIDYKGDLLLVNFTICLTLVAVHALKNNIKNIGLIFGLISGATVLIKFTILIYLCPLSILIFITLLNGKREYLIRFIALSIIGLIMVLLPWFIFYKIYLLDLGEYGLGYSKYVNNQVKYSKNICEKDYNYDVTLEYDIRGSNIIFYLNHLYSYLSGGTNNNILGYFYSNDPSTTGIFTFIIFVIVTAFYGIKFKNGDILPQLLITAFISICLGIYKFPSEVWYFAPSTVIFILTLNLYFYNFIKTHDVNFYKFYAGISYSIAFSVMLVFIFRFAPSYFYPLSTNKHNVLLLNSYRRVKPSTVDSALVADVVNFNKDKSKILDSSSFSYVNVYFYIENIFDRIIYTDQLENIENEEQFKKIVKTQNIKYYLLHNLLLDQAFECTRNQQKIIGSLFDKYGKVRLSTSNYTLYEVSGI